MAIWQGDVFFRRIIELTIQDIRENPWLVDDILSDFITDPMLSGIYGQKEIQNAKKWLSDNEISVFLPHRMDLEKMPCITISIGSNTEDKSQARLGDQTPFVETLNPEDIGKSVPYIIEPFQYTSYDQSVGFIELPPEIDMAIITPGMVVFDPNTANGYEIIRKTEGGIHIAAGTSLNFSTIAILPHYIIYRARREMATFQERITLGCHTHGDPSSLLWLYSFMMYGLLRYREGVLESRNFQLSNIETTDMIRNSAFQNIGENVYSRFITITGQVENTWLKAPKRIVESAILREGSTKLAGLKIISKNGGEVPEIIDTECEIWVAENEEE